MRHLLEETIEAINKSGHKIEDIIFIGSTTGYECSWEEFSQLADFEYDNGYGAAQVAQDLIIVFSDKQYLSRKEYDGSEWWEYTVPFHRPKETKKIKCIFASDGGHVGWVSLDTLNKD